MLPPQNSTALTLNFSNMSSVIKLEKLYKYYSYGIRGIGIQAVDGLSLEIEDGEVFGLLGPNGAGKSTTIKIILGLTRQNGGKCLIFGQNMTRAARKRIGYLPEAPYFYKYLSGFELVAFYARLSGMSKAAANAAAMKAINLVGLDEAANRRIGLYSKGMVQRAGLAQAIVHNPKLLILDEPASGLDPIGASDMADIILRLKSEGKTVLLCSHMMSEVEKLCGRVAILSRGKIAAMGRLDELLAIDGAKKLEFKNPDAEKLDKVRQYAMSLGLDVSAPQAAKAPLDEFFRKTLVK